MPGNTPPEPLIRSMWFISTCEGGPYPPAWTWSRCGSDLDFPERSTEQNWLASLWTDDGSVQFRALLNLVLRCGICISPRRTARTRQRQDSISAEVNVKTNFFFCNLLTLFYFAPPVILSSCWCKRLGIDADK